MHVQVIDFLSTMLAAIYDEAVTVFGNTLLASQPAGDEEHTARDLFVFFAQVVDGRDFFVWYNENVCGRRGVYVAESGYQVVTVDDVGIRFTTNDLRKYGAHITSYTIRVCHYCRKGMCKGKLPY